MPRLLRRLCLCPASTQSQSPSLPVTKELDKISNNSRPLQQPIGSARHRIILLLRPWPASRLSTPFSELTGPKRRMPDERVLFTHQLGQMGLFRLLLLRQRTTTAHLPRGLTTLTLGIACPSTDRPVVFLRQSLTGFLESLLALPSPRRTKTVFGLLVPPLTSRRLPRRRRKPPPSRIALMP